MSINPLSKPRAKISPDAATAPPPASERTQFLATMLIGVIFLLASVGLDLNPMMTGIGAGLLMVPYCLYALRKAESSKAYDQLADSCYYLGFLLTLIGLAISLFALGTDGNGEGLAVGVVARFGAAIVTTFVGMVFRIIIAQFRTDPEDAPKQAEAAIADSMRLVAKELEASVKQFEDIRRTTVNNINQATRAAETRINSALEKQLEVTEKFTNEAFRRHEAILDNLNSSLGTIVIDTEPLKAGLGDVMRAIEEQMGRLSAVLNNLGDAGEETERRWSGLKGRLDVVAASLESLAGSAAGLEQTNAALHRTGVQMTATGNAFAETEVSVNQLTETLRRNKTLVERMTGDIDGNLEDLKALRHMVMSEHEAAARATEAVYERLARALETISNDLAGAAAINIDE